MTATTKTITINSENIAKLEAAGFRRWTKGSMDRLYINAKDLGLEVDYYGTGSVRSAKWCGESVSNADGRRLLGSKVFVDVKTGELHVQTSFGLSDAPSVEDKAIEAIDAALATEIEPEPESEMTEVHERLIAEVNEFVDANLAAAPAERAADAQRMYETIREHALDEIAHMSEIDAVLVGNGKSFVQDVCRRAIREGWFK